MLFANVYYLNLTHRGHRLLVYRCLRVLTIIGGDGDTCQHPTLPVIRASPTTTVI